MVLQNPRLASSEILEYDEAPLDLSVNNRTRCPSPPRSPYYYRESLTPDLKDYQDGDDREYQDKYDRDTSSPHDSDDSDSHRHPNSAKAYKKAMMKRYYTYTRASCTATHSKCQFMRVTG
ncbi:hypothetical protein SK128_003567 [Halocaridina rubra]|uniref:Uncharacterized protein n=1 Tax=Halocaridina rubra TaxID=373956 RepID=A0AAN8XH87_HALRR